MTCTHELRPGTTLCLHCRHEAYQAREAGRRRTLVRGALATLSLIALVALGVAAAKVVDRVSPAAPTTTASAKVVVSPVESAAMLPVSDNGLTGVKLLAAAPVPHSARAIVEPLIDAGRTDLGDGIFAVRTGDSVRVHFDTELARTRRAPKFERIVRHTLPTVYGPAADSLLALIPIGAMTASGDLVRDLPDQGIRLDVRKGLQLVIHPETRPGRDGPIVVSYTVVGIR